MEIRRNERIGGVGGGGEGGGGAMFWSYCGGSVLDLFSSRSKPSLFDRSSDVSPETPVLEVDQQSK